MKTISLIGYSGSGKTFFIEQAIKKLKDQLNLNSGVIKNVHTHPVDVEGKDSHRFIVSGAEFALIKNNKKQNALFFNKIVDLELLIEWIEKGPFEVDVLFIEGFRNLQISSILCVQNEADIKSQISNEVKLISGLISTKKDFTKKYHEIPVINIENDFQIFKGTFQIE
ncbi:MAG: hypothetical protein EU532_13695 [Promethearchaeota archaeon]|nr:MAG: hypothetical protein EU532_13695 [Candidatus Lokiarchaeota archaeon]